MSETYSNVDASADPMGAVEWQERMGHWPAVQKYKRRTYDLLCSADLVVDVGCGPGVDVAAIGVSRCVGTDSSIVMATRTHLHSPLVVVADAHSLPFASGSVGGARADRVFQHLAEPVRALQEMHRVVRSGGRVVIADPDQSTLVIEVSGASDRVLNRLRQLRRDIGYRNGTLISSIPAQMRLLGFKRISVEAFPLTLTEPEDSFGLPTWTEAWRRDGPFSDDEISEWHAAIDNVARGGFRYSVDFCIVSGFVC